MKVFIFDPLWPKLVDEELEKKLAEVSTNIVIVTDVKPLAETHELFEGGEERLLCLNPDYVGWNLKNEDYETIPNLKGILIASTGFEWVEQDIANERNIPVCNIKGFSAQAVAEWATTIMLNLARQTPRLIKDDFPLDFDADFMKYRGIQIKGKVAGVIGLGNVGSAIAEACKGLGMEVVYWSRSSKGEKYRRVELDELFAVSDVVFPALAKNEETYALIGKDHVNSMKSSAIIVDMAHGLIDQEQVLGMVKEAKLFGYGFEAEPNSFEKYEGNVWAAPAYAWATYESMYNSEVMLIDNILAAVRGEFPDRVN